MYRREKMIMGLNIILVLMLFYMIVFMNPFHFNGTAAVKAEVAKWESRANEIMNSVEEQGCAAVNSDLQTFAKNIPYGDQPQHRLYHLKQEVDALVEECEWDLVFINTYIS